MSTQFGAFLVDEDGRFFVTEDGLYLFVTEDYQLGPGADPYDIRAAIDVLFPGIVVQQNLIEAAFDRWAAKGGVPLDSSDVTGILAAANVILAAQDFPSYVPWTQENYPAALPAYPTGLPRFPDSNPSPDGWSIVTGGKVVRV